MESHPQTKPKEESETPNIDTPHKVHLRDNTFGKCISEDDKLSDSGNEQIMVKSRSGTSVDKIEIISNRISVAREEKSVGKEGYLMKKSMHKFNKLLGWEKRYVTLKDDSFFWSISNTNVERRNTIKLGELEKCEKVKEDQFVLVIELFIY